MLIIGIAPIDMMIVFRGQKARLGFSRPVGKTRLITGIDFLHFLQEQEVSLERGECDAYFMYPIAPTPGRYTFMNVVRDYAQRSGRRSRFHGDFLQPICMTAQALG